MIYLQYTFDGVNTNIKRDKICMLDNVVMCTHIICTLYLTSSSI